MRLSAWSLTGPFAWKAMRPAMVSGKRPGMVSVLRPAAMSLMRPAAIAALKAPVLLASALALSACSGSGFWQYERDTLTLPGANPNMPVQGSENFARAHAASTTEIAPLRTEAGDIWPGPTQTVPTLKDLQKQQSAEMNGGAGAPTLAPLPALPSLPGYELSPQQTLRPPPAEVFSGSDVPTRAGHVPIQGNQSYKAPAGTADNGNIVVPNGNGTSTVISPTGQVTTIPTPGVPPAGTAKP